MRRRTFLAGLVAVPVAVACDPRGVSPVPWPVRPGGTSTSVPPTTSTTEAPVAELATLDPWHYVGDTGEPAFQNSWGNYGENLAYRLREDGVVDIQGYISHPTGASSSSNVVFTLPVGYRPSSTASYTITVRTSTPSLSPAYLTVTSGGDVAIGTDGLTDTLIRARISGQFYLIPASAP